MQNFVFKSVGIFLFCILLNNDLNAVPIYSNYQAEDIFTTKFKIGYSVYSTHIDKYKIESNSKGLNGILEINPFYATKFIHNIFMGLNFYFTTNDKINNNNMLLTLDYHIPLNTPAIYWIPNIDLYVGCGYAVRFTKIKKDLELGDYSINNSYIGKYGNGLALGAGVEIIPKILKEYGISYYIDYRCIWFDIKSNIYNTKKYEQYKNIFATMGIIYKSNFITKINSIK